MDGFVLGVVSNWSKPGKVQCGSERNANAWLKFCGLETEVLNSELQAEDYFCWLEQTFLYKVIDTLSIHL